jgi:hypothetical protein
MTAMASNATAKHTAQTAPLPQMTRFPARSSSCSKFKTPTGRGRRAMAAFCRHIEDNA